MFLKYGNCICKNQSDGVLLKKWYCVCISPLDQVLLKYQYCVCIKPDDKVLLVSYPSEYVATLDKKRLVKHCHILHIYLFVIFVLFSLIVLGQWNTTVQIFAKPYKNRISNDNEITFQLACC